jgi:hypothetical protein
MAIHKYNKKKIRGAKKKFLQTVKVVKITKKGFYLFARLNLYYFSFEYHPYFKYATHSEIRDVYACSRGDLHWDFIDVDIHFDYLENPELYDFIPGADLYPWIRPRVEKAGDDYEKFKNEDWYCFQEYSLLVKNLEKGE